MSKLKGVIKTVIAVCGIFLIIGCQDKSQLFWYKPDTFISRCWLDWQGLGEGCDYSKDCMLKKGYVLLKRDELPPGAEIEVDNINLFKTYGVAADNDAALTRKSKLAYEEYFLNIRKQWLENHPDVSASVKQAILRGHLIKGMSFEEAKVAWDSLDNSNWVRIASDANGYVIMGFGYNRLTFLNGRLDYWVEVSR